MRGQEEQGFIKLIILIVIGLLILKFGFDFDVIEYASREEFRTFMGGVWNGVKLGWAYIINGILWIWDFIASFFS